MYFDDFNADMAMEIAPAIIGKEKMVAFARAYDNIRENTEPCALLVMGYSSEEAKPIELHFKSRPIDKVVYCDNF